MKSNFFLISCFIFLYTNTKAQTLIYNGSFEIFDTTGTNKTNYCDVPFEFNQIKGWWDPGLQGWWEYYHHGFFPFTDSLAMACIDTGYFTGNKSFGTLGRLVKLPTQNKSFISLRLLSNNGDVPPKKHFYWRGYLATQLTKPLRVGCTYRISFDVCNGIIYNCCDQFVSHSYIDKIGVYFTTQKLQLSKTIENKDLPTGIQPQVEVKGIVKHQDWTTYTLEYTADSAYQYFNFGNFYAHSQTNHIDTCYKCDPNDPIEIHQNGLYFFDNFAVTPHLCAWLKHGVICQAEQTWLYAQGEVQPTWYQIIPNQPPAYLATADSLLVSPTQTTKYITTDGVNTDTLTVYVIEPITINFETDSLLWCYHPDTPFLSLTPNINGTGGIVWSNEATTISTQINQQGIYWVQADNTCFSQTDTLIVYCPATDTTTTDTTTLPPIKGTTKPKQARSLALPTAFSPNNDGINDRFTLPQNQAITQAQLIVYNRYGQRVFNGNAFDGWSGTLPNNTPAPVGVYVYMFSYTNPLSGLTETQKGNITLLR